MTPLEEFRKLTGLMRENLAESGADSMMLTWGPVTLRVTPTEAHLLTPDGRHVLPAEGDPSPGLAAVLEHIDVEGES